MVLTGEQKSLGTNMNMQDLFIEGYLARTNTIHGPVQFQTTGLIYYNVIIQPRRDLVCVRHLQPTSSQSTERDPAISIAAITWMASSGLPLSLTVV